METEYSENPAMFKNNPIGFIVALALIPAFGLGLVILIYWFLSVKASKLEYSINKGEKIVFCIRAKDGSNKLEPLNTMLFVAIHELSHLMTKSIGHNQEFWDNMRFLLNDSINSNLYTKEDYFNNPVDYCGTVINDSPLK